MGPTKETFKALCHCMTFANLIYKNKSHFACESESALYEKTPFIWKIGNQ